MATNYRLFLDRYLRSAPWRGDVGRRLKGAWGLIHDAIGKGLTQALLAPWMSRADGVPFDSQALYGQETQLPRYPGETAAQYLTRLAGVWDTWQLAGGPEIIVTQLALAGWPGAQLYTSFEWPGAPPTGYWSQFWLFFPEGTHPVTAAGPEFGSFTFGDGTAFGPVGITGDEIALIRAIVDKFRDARWIYRGAYFELEAWTYGTGHLFGESGLVFGGSHAFGGIG